MIGYSENFNSSVNRRLYGLTRIIPAASRIVCMWMYVHYHLKNSLLTSCRCYFAEETILMLCNPLFITNFRRNDWYINGHFRTLKKIFSRIFLVFALYFRFKSPVLAFNTWLRSSALLIAELIPSNELGLIKPAASPIRKTPFLPQQKSWNCLLYTS